jgi:hypothetical protein
MISEIVLFSLPQGMSREEAMASLFGRAILTAGGLTPSRSGQNL